MEIKSDSIAEKDTLNRNQFSLEIVKNTLEYLDNNSESLVIGINGSWGSGKSTLLHFIKVDLTHLKKNKYHIFEFNPWIFSGKEELHTIFLNQLSIAIGSSKQKLRNKIRKIADSFRWLEDVNGITKSASSLSKKLHDVSILDQKNEINELLKAEGIKTLILIDDIDRLTPKEIMEIFQLIRLNANFSNTVFIICFDKAVVKNAIANEFKLDGEKYLEKIIQVDYTLPSILPEDLETLFFQNINELSRKHEIDFDQRTLNEAWIIKGLRNQFNNVRDINRYFNAIQFRLLSFHKNVNAVDFLIIEAIRLFDYDSYELIRSSYKEVMKFGEKSKQNDSLIKLSESPIGDLYKFIFGGKNNSIKKNQTYRISDLEFFDRYFSLDISKKDMREEDLQYFLTQKNSESKHLANLIETEKIQFLLRRLSVRGSYPPDVDKEKILSSLISVWTGRSNEFVTNWRLLWDALKTIIALYEDGITGCHAFIDEITKSDTEFSPARFLLKWLLLENLEKGKDKDMTDLQPVIESRKQQLVERLVADIRNFSNQFLYSNLYDQFYDRIFLLSFAKYIPELYKENLTILFQNPQNLFKILNILVLRDSRTTYPFGLDFEYSSLLLPSNIKDEFESKLRAINLKTLPKNDAETIRLYLKKSEN